MDAKTNEIYTALPSVKSVSQTLVDIALMLGLAKIKFLTQLGTIYILHKDIGVEGWFRKRQFSLNLVLKMSLRCVGG